MPTTTQKTLVLRLQHAVLAGLHPCAHAEDDPATAPHWVASLPDVALCGDCLPFVPRPLTCDACGRAATTSRIRFTIGETTVHAHLCSTCLLPAPGGDAA